LKSLIKNTVVTAAVLLTFSCSSVYDKMYPTLTDGKYDSEFPYNNSSQQLEQISKSIKLLNSIAFYTGYVFDSEPKFSRPDLLNMDFEKNAIEKVYFNRTSSGTATLIYTDQDKIGLLSVAHIVNYPDTIISYFVNPDGSFSKYIQSISIKSKQSNFAPDLPNNGELDIILLDKVNDIAVLGMRTNPAQSLPLTKFEYPWGKSSELEWGSFVYVFGFPMNYKMISKGIVSKNTKEKNTFLIDAVFNKGYSGGIVLAIRDGVPNFELVGLVRSVPAEYEYTIRPLSREHDIDYNPMIPYKGDLYVDKQQTLRIGITKVIAIEQVTDFFQKNKDALLDKGYFFSQFFPPGTTKIQIIK
jgi:hypothetical protein